MRWKTTLVLLILTVAVGAYVSLYELKQPTREEQQRLGKEIVTLVPDEVTGLTITGPSSPIALQRIDGAWRLASPGLAVRADETLIRRILNALAPLEAQRTLDGSREKPLNLAQFGLDPPKLRVLAVAGQRSITVLFGEATAVGARRYAKLPNSGKVYVINGALGEWLSQPRDSFRSHELLTFDAWKAQRVTVTSPTYSYTLATQDHNTTASAEATHWQLISPMWDAADSANASSLVGKLRRLRIDRFVTDQPRVEQVPEWGFDVPAARITITLKDSSQPMELLVGKPLPADASHVYAKRVDEATIYAVDKASVNELIQDPQTLRSTACFDFDAAQVTRAHVTWQATDWAIERQQGQWKIVETGAPLEASRVDRWLEQLRGLTITRFVEELSPGAGPNLARYALDPPRGKVEIWLADAKDPQQLLVGDVVGATSAHYALITGRSTIVELPANLTDLLTTKPDSLNSNSASTPATPKTPLAPKAP